MKEYIEREAALEILKRNPIGTWRRATIYSDEIKSAMLEIGSLPAADVAEVRHGRWVDKTNISRSAVEQRVDCSVCGQIFWSSTVLSFNYCPNCGALMKENEHETG